MGRLEPYESFPGSDAEMSGPTASSARAPRGMTDMPRGARERWKPPGPCWSPPLHGGEEAGCSLLGHAKRTRSLKGGGGAFQQGASLGAREITEPRPGSCMCVCLYLYVYYVQYTI